MSQTESLKARYTPLFFFPPFTCAVPATKGEPAAEGFTTCWQTSKSHEFFLMRHSSRTSLLFPLWKWKNHTEVVRIIGTLSWDYCRPIVSIPIAETTRFKDERWSHAGSVESAGHHFKSAARIEWDPSIRRYTPSYRLLLLLRESLIRSRHRSLSLSASAERERGYRCV